MSPISYRVVNDKGEYMPSRPWHVEANCGFGWSRVAVCLTRADADAHVELVRQPHSPEDAMMLGDYNS